VFPPSDSIGIIDFAYLGGSRVALFESDTDDFTFATSRHLILLDAPIVSEP
jgi:hypothetical protein